MRTLKNGMRTLTLLAVALLSATALADKPKSQEPGPKAKGKLCEWKSKDGLEYVYFVPKGYDEGKGANLTFILHGSNLGRGWGFSNHRPGEFREDDVVVSPDGTTSNGRGGFNFLGEPKDAQRFRALLEELKQAFKVNCVFLYGHSQGSFFALYYAGEYPADVQGVLAHASGVWTWTKLGPEGHHQAIVLMHGTRDDVVPFGQSVGGYDAYVEAKYPMVRLRTIEGGNHWPAELNYKVPYPTQELAWIEGMTTKDPARLAAAFETLSSVKVREYHDYAALYSLAKRIAEGEAPDPLKAKARSAMEAVDQGAKAHADSLRPPDPLRIEAEGWIGHLPMFLRAYRGVPACDAFAETWAPVLKEHADAAIRHLRAYHGAKDPAEGFAEGVAAIREGFLYYGCMDPDFLKRLAEWRKDKKLKLPKDAVKEYDTLVPDYEKAIKEGFRSFEAADRKVKM
jgi:poly(3-hydroxybutyrate) depolymerase